MEFKIQQVSEKLRVPKSTIRYWETEFPELVKPKRTDGGQRRYSEKHIGYLIQIKDLLHVKNKTIEQARNILEKGNSKIRKVDWRKKSILLTGGTGYFGRYFCKIMFEKYHPKVIRIYSRDELKQNAMAQKFRHENIRYFIGDVRDIDRLRRAMEGVDIVVQAAALNQVRSCEYNPLEAVKTNILGANNIIDAAIDVGIQKVMAISTDKAVYPVNIYGATALCAEKIFVQGNVYSGSRPTLFSCFRCGKGIESNRSLISLLKEQKKNGIINIINEQMTRFWITMEHAVELVIKCLEIMEGGEIFVPKVPSIRITDFIKTIAPDCEVRSNGIKNGEKIHEIMINEEDGLNTIQHNGTYIILPDQQFGDRGMTLKGKRVPEGFTYTSETNDEWLSFEDIKSLHGFI